MVQAWGQRGDAPAAGVESGEGAGGSRGDARAGCAQAWAVQGTQECALWERLHACRSRVRECPGDGCAEARGRAPAAGVRRGRWSTSGEARGGGARARRGSASAIALQPARTRLQSDVTSAHLFSLCLARRFQKIPKTACSTRANRTRPSTQPHAKQQPTNAPPQTNLTITHTHLPTKCVMPPEVPIGEVRSQSTDDTAPHRSHTPSATPTRERARQGNHRLRELHRPLRQRLRPLPPLLLHLPLPVLRLCPFPVRTLLDRCTPQAGVQ